MKYYITIHVLCSILTYLRETRLDNYLYFIRDSYHFVSWCLNLIFAPVLIFWWILESLSEYITRKEEKRITEFQRELEIDVKINSEMLEQNNLTTEHRRSLVHKLDYQKHILARFKHKFKR